MTQSNITCTKYWATNSSCETIVVDFHCWYINIYICNDAIAYFWITNLSNLMFILVAIPAWLIGFSTPVFAGGRLQTNTLD